MNIVVQLLNIVQLANHREILLEERLREHSSVCQS